MAKMYANYDSGEVFDSEIDVLVEKLGSEEKAMDAIHQWVQSEMEALVREMDKSYNSDGYDRLEHTIETKDGDIWVCLKLLNVNRLWKMFGTEPER